MTPDGAADVGEDLPGDASLGVPEAVRSDAQGQFCAMRR
jgi:hypothetical protein